MIDTPRASQLLELLATGPPELRATEDAKKMSAERKEIERLQKAIDELERADKRLQKAIDRLERANKKD
jgi:prefoldin subunit 5